MSNYTQTTFFAPKDLLLTGNPAKLIKGADIDPELGNIASAISSKYDSGSSQVALLNANTFAVTLSGAISTTGTLSWSQTGNQVTIYAGATITAASSSVNAITITGVPAGLRPASTRIALCASLMDASTAEYMGRVSVVGDATLIVALLGTTSSGPSGPRVTYGSFTGSGNAGLLNGWSITYSL